MDLHAVAYGCVYLAGFLLYTVLPSRRLSPFEYLALAVFAANGAILGGRAGYCLCYEPGYYTAHPLEILQLWRGGMSFHGGVLGLVVGLKLGSIFLKSKSAAAVPDLFLRSCDRAALCALWVVPLGRVVNFYNGELWGRVTDLPWGVLFAGADLNPRHPVQLYEAFTEGPLLALLLYFVRDKEGARDVAGRTACLYLLGYSLLRFLTEFVREPDRMVGLICGLTLGQWLSLSCAAFSVVLWRRISQD